MFIGSQALDILSSFGTSVGPYYPTEIRVKQPYPSSDGPIRHGMSVLSDLEHHKGLTA